MTPKPSQAQMVKAQAVLNDARARGVSRARQVEMVAAAVNVPIVAVRFWIALIDGTDYEEVDPQYIPDHDRPDNP